MFSPSNSEQVKLNKYEADELNKHQQQTKFYPDQYETVGINWCKIFCFL